ncbi:TetR/AcrR family transcriptional regulator [Streptomyces sp. IB2014 016-6]|uniref:TetR/AcrR family transcriptional regulator n=1 Tax=Streptomyces sp. IB2014 016-6 TaxID=2517818 RepID=UPI0011C90062|nr:TetR/AcrR family transcriptional regulator [Streptomyces sp. IB2014 016-6]TXL89842.1 TetR/AcrR family transcriptional regulator [Streptomyces sp. IB2014 016-6]
MCRPLDVTPAPASTLWPRAPRERANSVSKERIYGCFGSKEKLFAAVVSEALTGHAELLGPPAGDPAEFAGRIYDLHRRNPQLLRLMMWEARYYDDRVGLPNEQPRTARYRDRVATLSGALGTESDTEAASTLLALVGLAILPTAFPQITRLILGSAADDSGGGNGTRADTGTGTGTGTDADLRAHIVQLARRMVSS